MGSEQLPTDADNLWSMLAVPHFLCRQVVIGFLGKWVRFQENLPADKMSANIS